MAGFRPNSEIIGNFRKIENFYDHFINDAYSRILRRVLEPRYRNLKSRNLV